MAVANIERHDPIACPASAMPRAALIFILLLGGWLHRTAWAQHVLYVEHDGRLVPVKRAKESRAIVELDSKLVPASGEAFALKKVEEYFPVLISIRNVETEGLYNPVFGTGQRINSKFHFEADLESSYQLADVFVVLALHFKDGADGLFLHEIGGLDAYKPQHFTRTIPMTKMLQEGSYELYLFASGREVFTSAHPLPYRDAVLDGKVARRVAGVREAGVKRFVGPIPQYPLKLTKARVVGSAVVQFRVGVNGAVLTPEVAEATDTSFGDAALSALQQSRFLPKIEGGRPG